MAYQLWFPFIMFFWIVPALFPVVDFNAPYVEPPSWSAFFVKLLAGFFAIFLFMLGALYYKQDSMFYVPAQPF